MERRVYVNYESLYKTATARTCGVNAGICWLAGQSGVSCVFVVVVHFTYIIPTMRGAMRGELRWHGGGGRTLDARGL